ncbi:outer membrane receptor protein involved in Fe transport [Sphingopyxis sp. OAS728]|uniref:TonB-dependent receptor n=1 Tax=Sphingopyxis sp. OAS728 TaxID=2663823 RepID=UPI00178BB635|nr:TonB-dependent receptor [Sphingopyxis sp. OAS728]MBE1529112.1 outer membrane receptor protein involved in Fe transport [Sphingopyxis sp. OAS728]
MVPLHLRSSAALIIALLVPTPEAMAQIEDPADIIVTARKREEQAIRVPAAPRVLRAEELANRQVTDLYGVASLTPGLILGAAPLEVGTEVSLRGIGASPLDPGMDQSVALNIDGLPLGQGAAYSAGLFDMDRIEILKGPQPLFFGKNSPGGVIAIRTADPGEKTEIIGALAYETRAREWQADAIVSGHVAEGLKLRLATRYTAGDGYFRNTALAVPGSGARQPDARFGRNRGLILRLTTLFEPASNFSARIKLNATHDRRLGGLGAQLVDCPEGIFNYLPTIGLNLPSQYSANEDCRADRNVNIIALDDRAYGGLPNEGENFTDLDQRFATAELNWTVAPDWLLTSVTGYYHLTADALQNGPWSGGAGSPIAITKALRREEVTQELRLTSDRGGLFDVTAGAFFQDGNLRNDIGFFGNSLYGFPPVVLAGSHDIDIRALALFGQIRARPTSRFEIAGGLRWTDERRRNMQTALDAFGAYGGVPGATIRFEAPRLKLHNWSPEMTIAWYPTDELTIFGAYKQGNKSGSYNINQPPIPGTDNSFGDERGRGGEVGIKGYAGDRQFYFDLTGYHYRYKGLQAGVIRISAAGVPALATVNAGAATVYGADLTLRYRPRAMPGLSVTGALNWNHGRFTRFVGADCKAGQTVAEGCNLLPTPVTDAQEIAAGYFSIDPASGGPVRYNGQDLSGTPLPRAPAWQGTLSVGYERPLTGKLTLSLGANFQYSSRYVVDIGNRERGYQDAFAKLGAHVRLAGPDDRWEVALIGNNLTNRYTTGGCLNFNYPGGGGVFPGTITGAPIKGPAGSGEVLCGFEPGRQFWLRLTLRPSEW